MHVHFIHMVPKVALATKLFSTYNTCIIAGATMNLIPQDSAKDSQNRRSSIPRIQYLYSNDKCTEKLKFIFINFVVRLSMRLLVERSPCRIKATSTCVIDDDDDFDDDEDKSAHGGRRTRRSPS